MKLVLLELYRQNITRNNFSGIFRVSMWPQQIKLYVKINIDRYIYLYCKFKEKLIEMIKLAYETYYIMSGIGVFG